MNMTDSSQPSSTPSPGTASKPSGGAGAGAGGGGRTRIISSCLTCRRRKVRCDHVHPVCGACTRGNHVCTYASDQMLAANGHRIAKPAFAGNGKMSKNSDVQARLDRLELLFEKAVAGHASQHPKPPRRDEDHGPDSALSPSNTSQTSQGISSDNHDGTLLLDGGQSHFVSSLHYALLAEEIQDIKALLDDRTDEGHDGPTANNLIHLLSLGKAKIGVTLEHLLPSAQDHRDALLEVYFTNVDPLIRITHKPSLIKKFLVYSNEAHPLAFAIFHSAVNALSPAVVVNRFGESKDELLAKFELGVQIGLARANYLTSSSIELLQAFLLWLTCITREEDMGKAWALLGIAIRIALNQGLHRDPSLFPPGSFDSVTVETRRRVWHQICSLEFRAAECKGQEPGIDEDDYTTLLPRNIDDEDLLEGESPRPQPYNEERFTSMTYQLVRFASLRVLRRIVKDTYRLERRMLESGLHGTSGPDPTFELQTMYEQIKQMVLDMHEENYRKYTRFCSLDTPIQRLILGSASLQEWRCYLIFWLRMPRAYRDIVFPHDVRKSIFIKSVNCIETLNNATVDIDVARFQWYIGGHASFQAIMHVLAELRNPMFETPDRARAIRALQLSRILKDQNQTKPWLAVKAMIDRVVADQMVARSGQQQQQQQPETGPFSGVPGVTSIPMHDSATAPSLPVYEPPSINHFAAPPPQASVPGLMPQTVGGPQMQQMPPQQSQAEPMAAAAAAMGAEQNQSQWEDLNFNNIIGDWPSNADVPELDFGFWGDPVNFTAEPAPFAMEEGYPPAAWND